jgi:hypothetical protein
MLASLVTGHVFKKCVKLCYAGESEILDSLLYSVIF